MQGRHSLPEPQRSRMLQGVLSGCLLREHLRCIRQICRSPGSARSWVRQRLMLETHPEVQRVARRMRGLRCKREACLELRCRAQERCRRGLRSTQVVGSSSERISSLAASSSLACPAEAPSRCRRNQPARMQLCQTRQRRQATPPKATDEVLRASISPKVSGFLRIRHNTPIWKAYSLCFDETKWAMKTEG